MSLPSSALENSIETTLKSLSLRQKVAQLLMLGFAGATPNPVTQRFLAAGVGGVICFRDNFEALQPQTAQSVADLLASLRAALPEQAPPPFFSIDQEGGQVERLPHTLFPSTITPLAIGLSEHPAELARQTYGLMAEHLARLGFNMNFFPTLDVNLEPRNPIIGVRAFGNTPEIAWQLGEIAMRAYAAHGVIAVGKHFPGHGNGTVDSHLDLPTLRFTEAELQPFRQAVEAGIPAMLVAHGLYPDLQPESELASGHALPSSASSTVIQGLLRGQLGFEGLVITDDMCMGAITEYRSPVAAARLAIEAGVDILLYRQSTENEWAIYESLVQAFETNKLSPERLDASVRRILRAKASMVNTTANPAEIANTFAPERITALSGQIARQAVSLLSGNASLLPLGSTAPLLLLHPDRTRLGNYAFDAPTSPELDALLRQNGFTNLEFVAYTPKGAFPDLPVNAAPKTIVFITFNPLLDPGQVGAYRQLRQQWPNVPIIIVSAGTADDAQAFTESHPQKPDLHIALCSYRPASMQALADRLRGYAE